MTLVSEGHAANRGRLACSGVAWYVQFRKGVDTSIQPFMRPPRHKGGGWRRGHLTQESGDRGGADLTDNTGTAQTDRFAQDVQPLTVCVSARVIGRLLSTLPAERNPWKDRPSGRHKVAVTATSPPYLRSSVVNFPPFSLPPKDGQPKV